VNASKVRTFLKKHGRTIIEIATLVGVVLTLLQYNLEQKQFTFEQLQRPELEYSYHVLYSDLDRQVMAQNANQLVENYYEQLCQLAQTETQASYQQLTQSILPITVTIPSRAVEVTIDIHNGGMSTATEVRAVIELNRPISAIEVDSSELYEIVRGEIGEDSVTVEIDRIVANSSASIAIKSHVVSSIGQQAQLVLTEESDIKYEYDANGNLTRIVDSNGHVNVTQFGYDDENRLREVINPRGHETQYTYDARGNLAEIIDAEGNVTRYVYDEENRLIMVVDPLGNQIQYTYDTSGNVTYTYDGSSKIPIDYKGAVNGGTLGGLESLFPHIRYSPAQEPDARIFVTSNEGAAILVGN
jgi:YD repeat-containing protein